MGGGAVFFNSPQEPPSCPGVDFRPARSCYLPSLAKQMRSGEVSNQNMISLARPLWVQLYFQFSGSDRLDRDTRLHFSALATRSMPQDRTRTRVPSLMPPRVIPGTLSGPGPASCVGIQVPPFSHIQPVLIPPGHPSKNKPMSL